MRTDPSSATHRLAPRSAPEVLFELFEADGGPPATLHARLCSAIRAALRDGRIAAGTRLPPTRSLASTLGVSRSTVVAVFEQLVAEGVLDARAGSGTFAGHALAAGATARRTPPRAVATTIAPLTPAEAAGVQFGALLAERAARAPMPFRPAAPDVTAFPWTTWRRIVQRTLRQLPPHRFTDSDPRGDPELRRAIATHLRSARGIDCDPDELLITAGSQQAIDLIARAVLAPGDPVWFEHPGYTGAWIALATRGATLHPVAVDADGACIDTAIATLPAPRLVYVTPSNQFPLGSVLSGPRRAALLRHVDAVDGWVLEDDYDGEYRAPGLQVPPLRAVDGGRRVFHVGTFSKTLFGGLRCGWVVAPPALLERMTALRIAQSMAAPVLEQAALARFVADGHHARHVRRMRALYARRGARLLAGLRAHAARWLVLPDTVTGLQLAVGLVAPLSAPHVHDRLAEAGVESFPLTAFCWHRPTHDGLLLGFSAFDDAAIDAGVARLVRGLSQAERDAGGISATRSGRSESPRPESLRSESARSASTPPLPLPRRPAPAPTAAADTDPPDTSSRTAAARRTDARR
jgi:GntR family transcriptional regulator/MocR family aminotransferase